MYGRITIIEFPDEGFGKMVEVHRKFDSYKEMKALMRNFGFRVRRPEWTFFKWSYHTWHRGWTHATVIVDGKGDRQ